MLEYGCPVVLPTGEHRRIRATADVITDRSGNTVLVHGTAQVIAPVRFEAAEAPPGPATGLARHPVLRERGEAVLARARRKASATAMLVLDIDQFHEVNDEFGVRAGDELLATMAA